jgi:SM-20-related protein
LTLFIDSWKNRFLIYMVGVFDAITFSSDEFLDCLVDSLHERGYAVFKNAIPSDLCAEVSAEIFALSREGKMSPAGIGQGTLHLQRKSEIRGDRTFWFESDALSKPQTEIWSFLESARLKMNRELFLGLRELEGHYASYVPGAFYKPHFDRFTTDSSRTVSAVLFFNEDWKPEHGGALRLHLESGEMDILPQAGTVVFFLSDRVLHEVTETRRERMSFAGWFKTASRSL